MKIITGLGLSLLLALSPAMALSLAAQAPQTAAKPPVAKPKPPAPIATAPAMPQPASEIDRVLQMLQGRWTTEEKFEPSEMLPKGGTGKGQEAVRPGPGKMSLIAEYSSQGPMGEFSGIGLMTWDPAARVYQFHWTDSANPAVTVMIGKWEGKDLVFTGSETTMGKKVYSRHAFTDITPTTFTYTIDEGPAPTQLKRSMTIHYTKLDMQEMRRRQFRQPQ